MFTHSTQTSFKNRDKEAGECFNDFLKIIFQDPEDETIKLFDDHLTETVANCFSGPQTDEGIQVQVLKALLSIVTSGHIRVHQETLLLAVKTCYNIFLGNYSLNSDGPGLRNRFFLQFMPNFSS